MVADLWTPEQSNAELDQLVTRRLRDHVAEGGRLEHELRKVDPQLRVGFIGEKAPRQWGIIPGRWHVIRLNDGAPPYFLPIAGDDGEYLEPSFQIIEEMKSRDLWKAGAMEGLMRRRQEETDRRQKEADNRREGLKDESAHTFRAAKRVSGEGGMTKRRWGAGHE